MRHARYLALPLMITLVCLGCSGCFGLRNRIVLQHACEECRHGPFCAFETLEAKYCVLCQKPLDGRASMSEDARYGELEATVNALENEYQGIFERHQTPDDDYAAAFRIHSQCGAIREWIAKERTLSRYLDSRENPTP